MTIADTHDEYEDALHSHISFSGAEVFHLVMSVAVLSFAFTFAFNGMGYLLGNAVDLGTLLATLPYAAGIVVASFVLHELAHKFVAQRLSMWAEYRSSFVGLGLGLVLSSLFGVVLAAPGAVQIYGRATDRDAGVISLVGPLVNLALGFIVYPFAVSPDSTSQSIGSAGSFLEIFVFINMFLALFNMVPVPPLDGSKVWRWSKTAYFATIALIAYLAWLYFSPTLA